MKKVGSRLLLVLMLALVAVSAACGDDDDAPSGEVPTEVVRERDGVRMTLSVDKETYGPDDTVRATLKIENTNQDPVDYRGKVPSEAGLSLLVSSDLASPQPIGEGNPDDMTGTLAAGAKLERQVDWDKVIKMQVTPVTAPPGTYSISATFLLTRPGFADLIELGAAVSFEVEGTGYIQPPLDALNAVLASADVKAWAEGRGDTVVCAYAAHDFFYNGSFSTGSGAETFDFLYDQQLANGDTICGIGTDGDAWRFVFFGAKGDEPHRLTVHVALDEPVVLSVTEGGPTAAPTATP